MTRGRYVVRVEFMGFAAFTAGSGAESGKSVGESGRGIDFGFSPAGTVEQHNAAMQQRAADFRTWQWTAHLSALSGGNSGFGGLARAKLTVIFQDFP